MPALEQVCLVHKLCPKTLSCPDRDIRVACLFLVPHSLHISLDRDTLTLPLTTE